MIKLGLMIITAIIFSLIISLAMDNDGRLVINWKQYEISVSLVFSLIILTFSLFICLYIINIFSSIKSWPKRLVNYFKNASKEKELNNIIDGFTQIASGDLSKIKRIKTSDSFKQINDLLQLQIAQIEDNDPLAEHYLQDMLKSNSTKLLAYKGLITIKTKQKDFEQALNYAKAAYKLKPKLAWPVKAMVELSKELKQYEQAFNYYQKLLKITKLDQETSALELALLSYQIADNFASLGKINEAVDWVKKSLKISSVHIESWTLYIDLLLKLNKKSKAISTTQSAWRYFQNYQLAAIFAKIYNDGTQLEKFTKLENLQSTTPSSDQGWISLAKVAIEYNEPRKAKEYLTQVKNQDNPDCKKLNLLLELANNKQLPQAIKSFIILPS
jgi:HemY protein